YTVKQESVAEKFQLSGTLLPNEFVDIKPEAQGLIRKILFTEGAKVNKGQLLVKLNDEDFQTQLRKAIANKKLK
ncbi:biotin/lipoyl-binding protein, partial [Umezakia ovalisporum]|uniref:biotin/lipoyl-binding protein n=1 Tax=Umezakia ovalisporum TaxID=75695 RepID=UPI0039C60A9E